MSGIAGIVGAVDDLEYRLAAMLRSMVHRGGDYKGFWVSSMCENRVGLAHCGSVVSEMEEYVHRPFVDEETRLTIVVDGDIYNYKPLRDLLSGYYKFATDSPMEVLSKAYRRWGADFLLRLEGVFALVIQDREKNELLLARDRYGVKPLYFAMYRGSLYFASEVRALFAAGVRRSLSAESWASYMIYSSYGATQSTFWENVCQLPPGYLMCGNGYSYNECRWYSLQDEVVDLVVDYDLPELEEMFRQELLHNTMQSMSDVSSCAFRMAGRVESQLLHFIASQCAHSWKMNTFIGAYDYAPSIGKSVPVWVNGLGTVEELEGMSRWVEEPFDGSETLVRALLFRSVRRSGGYVLCSGIGLDALWQDVWDVRELSSNYSRCHQLFAPDFARLATPPSYDCCFGGDADLVRYVELVYERIPHILRVVNRSAAESGINVRFPFLDGRLVALSFALPLASMGSRTTIFRKNIQGGYSFDKECCSVQRPQPLWDEPLVREWLSDALVAMRRSVVRDWFDARQLGEMNNDVMNGKCDDYALLWKVISLNRHVVEG